MLQMEGKKGVREYEEMTKWGSLWPRHRLFTLALVHATKGSTLIVALYLVLVLVLHLYMHCTYHSTSPSFWSHLKESATLAYVCFAVALFAV